MNNNYHSVPQPDELSQQVKEDAMGAYFMMFATMALGLPLPILNLIAAIIYLYMNNKKDRFIKFHSLQSLYSQIPLTIINGAAVIWAITLIVRTEIINNNFIAYLVFLGVINIIYVIFSLIGASRARKGQLYYFIFFGPLAFDHAYRRKANEDEETIVNKPPF